MQAEKVTKTIELTDEKKAALWQSLKKALRNADCLKECGKLIEAMVIFYTKEHRLHILDGQSWSEFKEGLDVSDPTVKRYIATIREVEVWAQSKYPARKDEVFTLNEKMVMEFVRDRRAKGLGSDIKSILEERKEHRRVMRYLDGENSMTSDEFKKIMKVEAEVTQPVPNIIPTTSPVRTDENLFTTHERIIEAGYTWDKDNGTYLNPDETVMTPEQLSEFVDENSALKVLEEPKKVLESARRNIVACVKQYKMFYDAYRKKHSSPKFIQLITEKHKEVEQEMDGIIFEVGLLLRSED